jgi:hypothetical protein
MAIQLSRRRFFTFAAPAIVAAPSLMRVSKMAAGFAALRWRDAPVIEDVGYGTYQHYSGYDELVTMTLRHRAGWLAENVTRNNAILKMLAERSNG